MWYSPDFPCSTLDKKLIFFYLWKSNRTEGETIKAPGFSPRGDLPCRRCRDPDGDGIPIYKLASVQKTLQLTRYIPSVPREPVTASEERFRVCQLASGVSLSGLWSPDDSERPDMTPGEQPHRARLNLPAEGAAGSPPSDEVDGSGSGTIWGWAAKFTAEYTSQCDVSIDHVYMHIIVWLKG